MIQHKKDKRRRPIKILKSKGLDKDRQKYCPKCQHIQRFAGTNQCMTTSIVLLECGIDNVDAVFTDCIVISFGTVPLSSIWVFFSVSFCFSHIHHNPYCLNQFSPFQGNTATIQYELITESTCNTSKKKTKKCD